MEAPLPLKVYLHASINWDGGQIGRNVEGFKEYISELYYELLPYADSNSALYVTAVRIVGDISLVTKEVVGETLALVDGLLRAEP